jgi:hypothetical protein
VAEVQTKKRPIAITSLGWLYIAVGALGTAGHYGNFWTQRPTVSEFIWITVLGVAAVLAGVFMLRGQSWARWLAIAWMAAHVVISVFHPLQELIVHCALLVLFCYVLFRREARAYFSAA